MPFPPGLVRTARGLSRRPGFAAGAILTLAVAIGVVRLVAGRGMRFVALGLAVGLPASYAVARAASAVLFGVMPGDPATYAVAVLALVVAGALACLVPALRAARLDPIAVLREP